jgi:hypothetical protein
MRKLYFNAGKLNLPHITKKREFNNLVLFLEVEVKIGIVFEARQLLKEVIEFVDNNGKCTNKASKKFEIGKPIKIMFGDPYITKQKATPKAIINIGGWDYYKFSISPKINLYSFKGMYVEEVKE